MSLQESCKDHLRYHDPKLGPLRITTKLPAFALTLLTSDRKTPLLSDKPIWNDPKSLRELAMAEKHLMPIWTKGKKSQGD